jgi:hypothetical protein
MPPKVAPIIPMFWMIKKLTLNPLSPHLSNSKAILTHCLHVWVTASKQEFSK